MRAQAIGQFGLEHLEMVERPRPDPGPGQVRVSVRACSLNYRDLLMVRGEYNPRQPLPLVPLSDGAGVVDAVGQGVSEVSVGQRVMGCFAQGWEAGEPTRERLRSTLGGPVDGMLCESVVLPERGVVAVPAYLSDIEASTLPCAALTAWSALVTQGHVRSGDLVLVQGTGGVSTFALDIARMAGARVIATTSSADKAKELEQRGAWKVINYVDDPQWGKTARRLTGGRGEDHVVEVGGAGTLQQSIRAVRPGGTISLIGVLAGGAAKVNLTPVLMTNTRIQGVLVGHRDALIDMLRALEQHQYRPHVDRVFEFGESRAAFEHLASGQHRGKVCIAVS
jgi:NADPH:quinone reductase-like Zn-dependent oxidoreductase